MTEPYYGAPLTAFDAEGPVDAYELMEENGGGDLLTFVWGALDGALTKWLHDARTFILEPAGEYKRGRDGYGSGGPLSLHMAVSVPRKSGMYICREYNLRDIMLEAVDRGSIETDAYRAEIADALVALAAEIRSTAA